MKTTQAKAGQVERKWYVVDATDLALGRLATRVARILMGKNKPIYTPHVDTGDHVVVINAEKIRVTGRKAEQKTYDFYSGYPGGRRVVSYETMKERKPAYIVEHAIRGMLPKSKLGEAMYTKLNVYAGSEHPHQAQQPEPLEV